MKAEAKGNRQDKGGRVEGGITPLAAATPLSLCIFSVSTRDPAERVSAVCCHLGDVSWRCCPVAPTATLPCLANQAMSE